MEYIVLVITLIVLIMNIIILIALSKNKDKSGADLSLMISEKLDKTRDEIIDEILDENKENTAILRRDIQEYVSREMASSRSEYSQKLSETKQELMTGQGAFKQEVVSAQEKFRREITSAQERLGSRLTESQKNAQDNQNELIKTRLASLDEGMLRQTENMKGSLSEIRENTAKEIKDLKQETGEAIKTLRESTERNLSEIRDNNDKKLGELNDRTDKKLDDIRGVVEEKLTETLNKRINESFKNVSDQLEQVYKGLGEMKNLAGDVGGLKQVLSGVKTRGILGEFQLGAILEEILSPEQYETNVATIPGSSERVEFAIKLPGTDGEQVYMPIDSKFPGDSYTQLQEAYESADKSAIDAAKKNLISILKSEAKDIKEKYVEVPYTTAFGIMFLPFEGLYSEAVNLGMVEVLQRDYHVNIAGPSTMGAMLNSLQMGFRTLAIQKRSNEAWTVLAAVKTEFEKFGTSLQSMQKHLNQTSKDLDSLMNTRTRAINRKLRDVQMLEDTSDGGSSDPNTSELNASLTDALTGGDIIDVADDEE